MDLAEFIELIVVTRGAVGAHVSVFITLVFAYLIMVYLAAANLRRFQVWAISAVYSVAAFLAAEAATQDIHTLRALMDQFRAQFPAEAATYNSAGQTYPGVWVTIALASWSLSITFVVQRRRERPRDDDA